MTGSFSYNNVRQSTIFIVHSLLLKNNTTVVPHPLYSPDLALFFLFLKYKINLNGQTFYTVEDINLYVNGRIACTNYNKDVFLISSFLCSILEFIFYVFLFLHCFMSHLLFYIIYTYETVASVYQIIIMRQTICI